MVQFLFNRQDDASDFAILATRSYSVTGVTLIGKDGKFIGARDGMGA